MGDGIPNLMKYAAGLDPTETYLASDLFSSSLQTTNGSTKLVMLYYKDSDAVNVYLYPVTAPAITGEWTSAGIENSFTGQTDANSRQLWKASIPVQGDTGFLRLRAGTEAP